jgi:UDP-N-acetylglucosamine 2-epimerase
MHRNPIVREAVGASLAGHPKVHLLEPLDYLTFVYVLSRAAIVVTDSGGIQEEAPSLGKPVLVIRDTTERPEGVAAGTARLVGTASQAVRQALHQLATDATAYARMAQAVNPYGDGRAASRVAELLLQTFAPQGGADRRATIATANAIQST